MYYNGIEMIASYTCGCQETMCRQEINGRNNVLSVFTKYILTSHHKTNGMSHIIVVASKYRAITVALSHL